MSTPLGTSFFFPHLIYRCTTFPHSSSSLSVATQINHCIPPPSSLRCVPNLHCYRDRTCSILFPVHPRATVRTHARRFLRRFSVQQNTTLSSYEIYDKSMGEAARSVLRHDDCPVGRGSHPVSKSHPHPGKPTKTRLDKTIMH